MRKYSPFPSACNNCSTRPTATCVFTRGKREEHFRSSRRFLKREPTALSIAISNLTVGDSKVLLAYACSNGCGNLANHLANTWPGKFTSVSKAVSTKPLLWIAPHVKGS